MYLSVNYESRQALQDALKRGELVTVHSPLAPLRGPRRVRVCGPNPWFESAVTARAWSADVDLDGMRVARLVPRNTATRLTQQAWRALHRATWEAPLNVGVDMGAFDALTGFGQLTKEEL